MTRIALLSCLLSLVLGSVGCGGSSGGGAGSAGAGASGSTTADAASAATGDIPDNQVFLTYVDAASRYAIRYPEGWTRHGSGATVAFVDKDNAIRLAVRPGAPPTAAAVQAGLARLHATEPTLKQTAAVRPAALGHGRGLAVSYSVIGAPDAVTGKRPLLLVDRYVYAHGGRVATVDLATPKGVDNVDAYRMISRSFAWR
jgi:prepilin-type processing-associated H-X9-DG protein